VAGHIHGKTFTSLLIALSLHRLLTWALLAHRVPSLQVQLLRIAAAPLILLLHIPPGIEGGAATLMPNAAFMSINRDSPIPASGFVGGGSRRVEAHSRLSGSDNPRRWLLWSGQNAGVFDTTSYGNEWKPLAFPSTVWRTPDPGSKQAGAWVGPIVLLRVYIWMYVALLLLPLANACLLVLPVLQVCGSVPRLRFPSLN
jgi:hypothetical protein